MRYGRATWIDADGATSILPVRYADGELTITVPEGIVEGSAYPAVLDPTVSPESGLNNIIVPLLAPKDQTAPDIAFDGTNYLVVWYDNRGIDPKDSTDRIYAARVSPAGALLDSGGTPIGSFADSTIQAKPAVVFDGTNYLVVWSRYESSDFKTRIRGVRVATDGTPLDPPAGIMVLQSSAGEIDLAFDGTNCLMVFTIGSSVSSRRMSKALSIVGGAISIASTGSHPSVSFNGSNYLVVWDNGQDTHAMRVSPGGVVLDNGGFTLSNAGNVQSYPAVACGAGNCFVVWQDTRWGDADIYGTRVDSSGVVLNPNGVAVAMTAGAQTNPAIAFDGTQYVVAWEDTRSGNPDLYAARVATSGVVLDASGYMVTAGAAEERAPAITCSAQGCMTAWEDKRAGSTWDIFGSRLDGAGAVLDPAGVAVTVTANTQSNPSVAWNGAEYLVVWEDNRSGTGLDLYATRVSAAGAVLDPSGIAVSTAPGDQKLPSVASNSADYLVLWQDEQAGAAQADIKGVRIGGDGSLLDGAAIPVSAAANQQLTPNLLYNGTDYFAVWSDRRSGSYETYAARVTPMGTVLDASGLLLGGGLNLPTYPSVAFDGTIYFVTWGAGSVYVRRVALDGTPLGAGPSFITSGVTPKVAFDGLNFLVVYATSSQVLARRITSAGVVVDQSGIALGIASNDQSAPTVVYDGSDCLVAWRNTTSVDAYISGKWVTESGDLLSSFSSVVTGSNHGPPAVATDSAGHTLLAYTRLFTSPPYGAYRTRVRLITGLKLGQTCAAANDCVSGFCVDGVCCDAPCGAGAMDCEACSAALGATADGTCTPTTGTPCNDSSACTQGDHCQAGVCVGGSSVDCAPQDQCHVAGTCNPQTGLCSNPAKPNGSSCDDTNACTQSDTCQAGTCKGASPVMCPAAAQCQVVAACEPASGACPVADAPDGTACDDGDPCTEGVCQGGACVTGAPLACPPPDQCHEAGMCDAATGQCIYAAKPNSTACNDGNPCTQTDTCQAGTCMGANPVVCQAVDACHNAGTCNPQTGMCSTGPNKPNGSACNDGNLCTQTDTCKNGACVGESPVVCASPSACQVAGGAKCEPATGKCSYTPKANGTACEDGSLCTENDTCQAGECVTGDPVLCKPLNECHKTGKCSQNTGMCSTPEREDGSPCTGGSCLAGECIPDGSGGGGSATSSSSSATSATSSGAGGGAASTGSGSENEGGGGSGDGGESAGGCGCGVAGSRTSGALWAAALLVLATRRRRAQPR